MKFIDNRHLKENLEIGDLIITEGHNKYMFIYDYDEKHLPYLQIDLDEYKIVDRYPKNVFNVLGVGSHMNTGGTIIEIHKNKNLTLSYTK